MRPFFQDLNAIQMLKLSVDVVDFDGPGASSAVSWPPPLTCASLMQSSAMCNVTNQLTFGFMIIL